MKWKQITLGEILQVKHGWAFKSEHFSNIGQHIVLTPGNFYEEGGFKSRGDKDRFYSGDYPSEYLLSKGNVIVAMTEQGEGLLGSAAIIPESNCYLHNQRLGLVTIKNNVEADLFFVYKLFNTKIVRQQISGSASGAKVKHTAPERIYKCKVELPPLHLQKKIAAILSAYDDLIENNLKRIKLLEEMAQITYEEWFVRLKFPGHETTPLDSETGLPEKWSFGKTLDLFELQRGFDLPIQEREDGVIPIIASTGVTGFHSSYKVQGPGVVTGRSGTIGQVMFVDSDFWPLNTTLWVKKYKSCGPIFVKYFLQNFNLESLCGGSAVPSLDRKAVHVQKVVIPSAKLMNKFEIYASSLYEITKVLRAQNELLKEARDILLPRLMTGMIDVDTVGADLSAR